MSTLLTLTPDQSETLEELLAWIEREPTPYITVGGYAGTGKTTLIAHLRRVISDQFPEIKRVAFCCYTGKAASVLRQKLKEADSVLGEDSCGTIHSLIYKAITDEAGQIIDWERVNTLMADLIIIDEGSMVNEQIWNDLRTYGRPIIVFGDHGQLPPIEGKFNLMESPVLKLETIVRQAAENPIIRLSQAVRLGKEIPYGSFYETVHKLPLHDEESREKFQSLVTDKTRQDYLCICGTNRTRINLNQQIRDWLGYEDEPKKGERVICLKNNYAKMIFNGMMGTIEKVKSGGEHWYSLQVKMEDDLGAYKGKVLKHQFNAPKTLRGENSQQIGIPEKDFGDLFDFGYAITAHKAQGSEAERVILFEERIPAYSEELWRRWLYTAVTRAKNELFIFS